MSTALLSLMMLERKGELQLGFGKVEFRDIHEGLSMMQEQMDSALKMQLAALLQVAENIEAFLIAIRTPAFSASLHRAFADILLKNEALVISTLKELPQAPEIRSPFGRQPLCAAARIAIHHAALREISEEIDFTAAGEAFDPEKLQITGLVNREEATHYVRSLLPADQESYSAREFNNDFESTTVVVAYPMTAQQLSSIECSKGDSGQGDLSRVVKPKSFAVAPIDPKKGIIKTQIVAENALPLSGGGNQYTVAYVLGNVFELEPKKVAQASLHGQSIFDHPAAAADASTASAASAAALGK